MIRRRVVVELEGDISKDLDLDRADAVSAPGLPRASIVGVQPFDDEVIEGIRERRTDRGAAR